MGKEIIIIGIVFDLVGISLLMITKFHPAGIIYGTIMILIGLALILLNKEENKIEKRRDKK